MKLSDADCGLLLKALWANGGGARGSESAMKRLVKAELACWKGLNHNSINESVMGARINITKAGKLFLQTGHANLKQEG